MDLEYEDALDFVKFRSGLTAAGTLDAPVGGYSGRGRNMTAKTFAKVLANSRSTFCRSC